MNTGIGRITLAVCLAASGACCVGVIAIERERSDIGTAACEPAVPAQEVAAVIEWARGVAAARTDARDAAVTAAGIAPATDAAEVGGETDAHEPAAVVVPVPASARAGGGKVSSIKPGARVGHQASRERLRRSARPFSRALNRPTMHRSWMPRLR